jgi:hypothetical protein
VSHENNFGFHQFFEGPFLVKRKPFLCILLLPIHVSHVSSANIRFRRCDFVFTIREKLEEAQSVKDVTDMKSNMTVENIPIATSMIYVLVFCSSSTRSQHCSWLSRMKPHGVWKKLLAKVEVL